MHSLWKCHIFCHISPLCDACPVVCHYVSQVTADQVVMSHSPLKMFNQFHDKHILVSGQGPVLDIAHGLGFTKMTTIDTVRQCFPHLDMVDHIRRKPAVSEILHL